METQPFIVLAFPQLPNKADLTATEIWAVTIKLARTVLAALTPLSIGRPPRLIHQAPGCLSFLAMARDLDQLAQAMEVETTNSSVRWLVSSCPGPIAAVGLSGATAWHVAAAEAR